MSSLTVPAPGLAPAIVSTVTAVPAFSASQAEVKARLREVFDLPARRLDAAMELFDHAGVERRYSVEPIERLGVPRPLGDIQDRYREHALGLGRKVAREALALAGVAGRDIDLVITTRSEERRVGKVGTRCRRQCLL